MPTDTRDDLHPDRIAIATPPAGPVSAAAPVPPPAASAIGQSASERMPAHDARAITADRTVADRVRDGRGTAGLTAGLALTAHSLNRSLRPLLAVGVVMIALQLVLVLQASVQQQAQSFGRIAEMLPAFLRRSLGDLTLVLVSFPGAVTAGYFHPVVVLLVCFLGIYFGSEPAYDVEAGYVDLFLARPLRRHWLITRSLALILIGTCAAPAMMAATMRVALHLFAPADAPWPTVATVLKMTMNLAIVAASVGTISLLVASRARRRGTAIAVAGVAAVFCYLVTFLEPTWAPAQAIGWLSPFHYYRPLTTLAARAEPWRDMFVLGTVGVLLTAAAYWQFNRRDL